MIGSDAWQATCLAFWIVPVMVHTRCNTHARITHNGEEDWSCVKALLAVNGTTRTPGSGWCARPSAKAGAPGRAARSPVERYPCGVAAKPVTATS
jgi:hypothetical protein